MTGNGNLLFGNLLLWFYLGAIVICQAIFVPETVVSD
jgi:hypothetical protein